MIIEKELFIKVAPKYVFEIITDSKEMLAYYPLNSIKSNWEIGGDLILKGGEGENEFTDYGVIDKIVKDKEFQYRYWSTNHGTERTPENHLTINYKLTEQDGGTKLALQHANFKSVEMHEQMNGIWDFLLSNLKKYAESK